MIKIEFPEEIKIGNSVFTFDLNGDVAVNRADLDGEFCRQAELFAKYSTAYELALEKAALLELASDRLEAQLDHQGRVEALSAGLKFTETMASNYVKGHADYYAAQEKLLHAQKIAGLLKQAKDAIVHKRDMLVQLGAHERQERSSDISMKTKVYRED